MEQKKAKKDKNFFASPNAKRVEFVKFQPDFPPAPTMILYKVVKVTLKDCLSALINIHQ